MQLVKKLSDEELFNGGCEKLDDALSYFDEMKTVQGKNIASSVYILLRYCELTGFYSSDEQ
jgi:hypothetical protein